MARRQYHPCLWICYAVELMGDKKVTEVRPLACVIVHQSQMHARQSIEEIKILGLLE